jgi:hypothetical protein
MLWSITACLILRPTSTPGRRHSNSGRLAPDRLRPQLTELTREERERRAKIPLLRRLMSERHHQQQQRSEADARARRLRQEVDKLDVYNMDPLQVESEALDLRMDISPHLRTSSSPLLPKMAQPVRVLLEERPRPVRDHLDSLIIPTTGVETPLGLMLNPIQSHLNSLVQAEDPRCGCLHGHQGPQQGLEVSEVHRPRDSQPPHAHALLTPQLRIRELQAV